MDKYKITFDTWNKIASLYQDKFMDLEIYNASYNWFCQAIKQSHASVLEVGCGPGNVTKYLLSQRPDFKLTAIDIAPNMINLAKVNCPEADFLLMDCRTVNQIRKTFNAIFCGFCMPYLSKEDCSKLIRSCYSLLEDKGLFYFSVIEGAYEKSGYEMGSTGDKAYVYYYEAPFLLEELAKCNFHLVKNIEVLYPKGKNRVEKHLIFIAQKDKSMSKIY